MIKVLVVAGVLPPRQSVLVEVLEQLRTRGVQVRIVGGFDPAELVLPAGLAEVRALPSTASLPPAVRKALKSSTPGQATWLHARRDTSLRRQARAADVLVATDPRAVHTVWQLAQRNLAADAVLGLAAAVTAVDARLADPTRYAVRRALRPVPSPTVVVGEVRQVATRTTRAAWNKATGKRVMNSALGRRFWSLAVAAPGIPQTSRVALTRRISRSMTVAGRPAAAGDVVVAAMRRVADPRQRTDMVRQLAGEELSAGRVPPYLAAVEKSELAAADAALAAGDTAAAAASFAGIVPLLFHRGLHFDGLTSPIADDPEKFLAPLQGSAVGRALAAPRGRSAPAADAPTDRPLRILFVTRRNDNFLTEIRDRYTDLPSTEVRSLDLAADPDREPLTRRTADLIEHVLAGQSRYGRDVQEWIGPHLEWADTVFVDWCVAPAAMLTLLDPGRTRVIVRLHSYEAFTEWPHLMDFSRVDDLLFVSEHLRDLTVAAVPRLRGPHAPRTPVITNAMDLRRYPREKPAEARFNLGLVGISAVAKDPRWAIEVLRELRQHDERYRLLLIGSDLNGKVSAAAKQYERLYKRDLAALEPDAVRHVGQTDDVPAALTQVGVILSSSVRESFHCGLVEGAASGAVPVVRDWPFFAAGAHGARTIFPADWVVDSPGEAAKRILDVTATEDAWRAAGSAASAHSLATWDWTVTSTEFDRLLLGRPNDPVA